MAESVVLLVVGLIGDDFLPATSLEAARKNVVALVSVEFSIARRVGGAGDKVEDALLGSGNILRLPALGEVVVPILGMGLRALLISTS